MTTEQSVFVIRKFSIAPNVSVVQNAFATRCPGRNPIRNTISKNVRKYQNTATSLNRNKSNLARRRTATNEPNSAAIRQMFQEILRGVSAPHIHVAVSKSSFNRITRLDLQWHPYRMDVKHKLRPNDLPRLLRYSNWFNKVIDTLIFTKHYCRR